VRSDGGVGAAAVARGAPLRSGLRVGARGRPHTEVAAGSCPLFCPLTVRPTCTAATPTARGTRHGAARGAGGDESTVGVCLQHTDVVFPYSLSSSPHPVSSSAPSSPIVMSSPLLWTSAARGPGAGGTRADPTSTFTVTLEAPAPATKTTTGEDRIFRGVPHLRIHGTALSRRVRCRRCACRRRWQRAARTWRGQPCKRTRGSWRTRTTHYSWRGAISCPRFSSTSAASSSRPNSDTTEVLFPFPVSAQLKPPCRAQSGNELPGPGGWRATRRSARVGTDG
jgi:hypothetical protein